MQPIGSAIKRYKDSLHFCRIFTKFSGFLFLPLFQCLDAVNVKKPLVQKLLSIQVLKTRILRRLPLMTCMQLPIFGSHKN